MSWISKSLTINLDKENIQPNIFAEHNPIKVVWKGYRKSRGRWSLNHTLLLQKVVNKHKKDLAEFFKLNNTEGMSSSKQSFFLEES